MVLEKIEEIINNKNKVNFKIYGVIYTIERNEDNYLIYQTLNNLRQERYNSLNEIFREYTIYNESLVDNHDRIEIIE